MSKSTLQKRKERLEQGNPNSRDKRRALRAQKDTIEGPWKEHKHCYFSATHKRNMINHRVSYHRLYYKLLNGDIVEVTEVFTDPERKSVYEDSVYLGLGDFHTVTKDDKTWMAQTELKDKNDRD